LRGTTKVGQKEYGFKFYPGVSIQKSSAGGCQQNSLGCNAKMEYPVVAVHPSPLSVFPSQNGNRISLA
jgi:hypothetical protein